MLKDSRILVTGAYGMLGSALVSLLQAYGYTNVCRSNGDLRKKEEVYNTFSVHCPEYVFHCAAKVYGIQGNATHRKQAFTDNILINTHVIDACDKWGVRKIVAMGSNCVYSDQDSSHPLEEVEVWNGPVAAHEAPYGNAKRAMLAMLEAYDIPYAFVVASNMYGPFDRFDTRHGHVIPSLVRKFYEASCVGGSVCVWGDGTQQRTLLFSKDAARGLIEIMNKIDGVVNLGGEEHTLRAVVEKLCAISGVPNEHVIWDTTAPVGHPRRLCSTRTMQLIGFFPEISLADGLVETYGWYVENAEHMQEEGRILQIAK